jgi:phosphoribosylformylglycinamidine synthase
MSTPDATSTPDADRAPAATPAASFRFAVNVTPREGILDPQGRAVEQRLRRLGVAGVGQVRVGRRVEMTVDAVDEEAARALVERLAGELLANPLIEHYAVERLGGASSTTSAASRAGGASAR